jgi:hypothetical protein
VQVYYHLQYVGDPRSYKWINTNSLVSQQYLMSILLLKFRKGQSLAPTTTGLLSQRETNLGLQRRRPEASRDPNLLRHGLSMGCQQYQAR